MSCSASGPQRNPEVSLSCSLSCAGGSGPQLDEALDSTLPSSTAGGEGTRGLSQWPWHPGHTNQRQEVGALCVGGEQHGTYLFTT